MKLPWKPIKARFISRPNRFTTIIKVDGEKFKAHIHDPGRLKELLTPNAEVLVREHTSKGFHKTHYYLFAVKHDETWVLVDSAMHGPIVEEALKLNLIKELGGYSMIGKEIKFMNSRIDFLLESPVKRRVLMEVKGCTLVINGLALFPDAPTERGRRHVKALIKAIEYGYEGIIFFLITRGDVEKFMPHWRMDPKFAEILLRAWGKGMKVLAYKAPLNIEKLEVKVESSVPILLRNKILKED